MARKWTRWGDQPRQPWDVCRAHILPTPCRGPPGRRRERGGEPYHFGLPSFTPSSSSSSSLNFSFSE